MELLDNIYPHIYKIVKTNTRLRNLAYPIWKTVQHIPTQWRYLLNRNQLLSPPNIISDSIRNWVDNYSLGNQKQAPSYKLVYPQHKITRLLPKTIDNNIHQQYKRNIEYNLPDAFVASIPNGRVWNEGHIITPDNIFFKDFIREGTFSSVQKSLSSLQKLPPMRQLSGSVAVLSCQCGTGYYHWMLELLPRLGLIEKAGFQIKDIDYFLVNQYITRFQMDTLSGLGIPRSKIIESIWYPHIQAERIIVPSLIGVNDQIPLWACEFLRQHFLKHKPENKRKNLHIYLNRSDVAHRKVENETEVIDLLSSYDFVNITAQNLSIYEKAELLSSAEIVVSPHGAGLSHLVFCQPGTKVIEILSPKAVSTLFWTLANNLGLDYYYLLGEGEEILEEIHYPSLTENIVVNLTSLKKMLLSIIK